jgi:excinuclease ABC subunit A
MKRLIFSILAACASVADQRPPTATPSLTPTAQKSPGTGHTLYLLDEPTTGLYPADTARLLTLLECLVEASNSVVVEHNLDLVKTADWVIDLGPEGGVAGGELLAEGTPEQVAEVEGAYTGQCLKKML